MNHTFEFYDARRFFHFLYRRPTSTGWSWRCSCGDQADGLATEAQAETAMVAHVELVDLSGIDARDMSATGMLTIPDTLEGVNPS